MDGGRSWRLLDSTVNVDASGNVLATTTGPRPRVPNVTSFKVIVDPWPGQRGGRYAAMGTGIWRSTDSGGHWTLLQAGVASDIVLSAAAPASTATATRRATWILYGAIEGQGCLLHQRPTALSMSIATAAGQ